MTSVDVFNRFPFHSRQFKEIIAVFINFSFREMASHEVSGLDLGKRRRDTFALVASHVASRMEFASGRRLYRAGYVSFKNYTFLFKALHIRCRN